MMKIRFKNHSLDFGYVFSLASFIVIFSAVFASGSWGVYGAPIIALKHAERAERAGNYLVAAADREFTADFYKYVSIPQFEDDMEFFEKIGEEGKAEFCRNTISGFQKSMRLCIKKAEENRVKGKLTKEQIDEYRERNRARMIAGCEIYPLMHNGQMGVDVGALEKNGDIAEDFEKAAEGRERTARLYRRITIPWTLYEADVLEKEGKVAQASEYREKAKEYEKKAVYNDQKADKNHQMVRMMQRFDDVEYVMDTLESEDPVIRKLALKRLSRDTNYLGLIRAAKSTYEDVSKMAGDALESNKKLFDALKTDLLVLSLSSADLDIRRAAIGELESLAGTTFGYRPDSNESERGEALIQWQEWIVSKLKNGLKGIYYKGKAFDKEILARVDKKVDFQWKNEPHKSMPKDKFSIRWIGKLKVPKAGEYTLSVKSDKAVRIWIGKLSDMKQVISSGWSEYNYAGHSNKVYLEEGLHDLKIEYFDDDKNAVMKLYWDSDDMKKRIIPKGNLFHVNI